jgi:hypothetical protein
LSNAILRLVPFAPHWQPSNVAADRTLALVRELLPKADDVFAQFYDEVTFFDAGSNWSGVSCPNCEADLDDWWGEAMDGAAEKRFTDLSITTPCCGARSSLNDLRYGWPCRFGKFALSARNPNVRDTTHEQDRRIAEALGSEVVKVWAHI